MSTDIQTVRDDMGATKNFMGNTSKESLAARREREREKENKNGQLSVYVGLLDIIQLRANKMWDRLGSLETEVSEQFTLIQCA